MIIKEYSRSIKEIFCNIATGSIATPGVPTLVQVSQKGNLTVSAGYIVVPDTGLYLISGHISVALTAVSASTRPRLDCFLIKNGANDLKLGTISWSSNAAGLGRSCAFTFAINNATSGTTLNLRLVDSLGVPNFSVENGVFNVTAI